MTTNLMGSQIHVVNATPGTDKWSWTGHGVVVGYWLDTAYGRPSYVMVDDKGCLRNIRTWEKFQLVSSPGDGPYR